MYWHFVSLLVLCASTLPRHAAAHPVERSALQPIMDGVNFPDPAVVRTESGWHLFSTNAVVNGKLIHVQRAFTSDWTNFQFREGLDALPVLPKWADSTPRVWAPDVVQLNDGTFVMYYTVAYRKTPNLHCLSFATTRDINKPFVDNSQAPWICPTAQGGAIDVAGFTDERNGSKRWVVYKIDGNSIGHGGSCGNTVLPIVPTPIMLQQVAQDGHTRIGDPRPILTNILSDGPYIEAPSLTYMNGKYVLFFSSQCYMTDKYDVQYAIADRITGPYIRKGRLMHTGTIGMKGPGGLDIAIDGDHAIWHAYVELSSGSLTDCVNFEKKSDCRYRNAIKGRAAFVGIVKLKGGVMKMDA